MPSGVNGLTGEVPGWAVRANRTVTFAARKPGLVFEPGRSYAGEIVVVDIGIEVDDRADAPAGMVTAADVSSWVPGRAPDAHKWQSGVLTVGGSGGMTGAPMLVSHAAMRAGAGIVWCALPGDDAARLASGTEVIMKPLPADDAGVMRAAGRRRRSSPTSVGSPALAVGPGLGGVGDPDVQFVVRTLVAEARQPLVLDADGLNALAGDLAQLRARQTLGGPVVLTPHAGEYQRLMGAPVGSNRLVAAQALAERSGAVVLLKGPGTVVASPDRAVALNPTGGASLATAGSGDVLTGIVAGFLARGLDPFRAAAAAAWVHGRTADRLVATDGPALVAGDLVDGHRSYAAGVGSGAVSRAPETADAGSIDAGSIDSGRAVWSEVDLDAIRANVAGLCAVAAPAALLAVVKANGYGHGAVPVARAALDAGASWLGVARIEEGEQLREAGIDAPIMLLSEPAPRVAARVVAAGLTPVVYTESGHRRAGQGRRRLRARRPARRAPQGRHRHAPGGVRARRRARTRARDRRPRRADVGGRVHAPGGRRRTRQPLHRRRSSRSSTPCSPRSTPPGCDRRSRTRRTRPGSWSPARATTSCASASRATASRRHRR